ncbi:MAG: 3'-5' exonuclease [Marinomonas sp.]
MERPTKDQIKALPVYAGLKLSNIKIIEDEESAAKAIEALESEVCLGFDTESKPIFRKGEVSPGPTLIQIASMTTGYLFPTRFPAAVSAAMKILSNPNIKKVGFGIKGDNKELRNKLHIDIVNTQDLSVTLKVLAGEKNSIGARAAVAMVLQRCLGKGAQMSNWGAYPLKDNQVLYAANDAHSAICVAKALNKL